MPCPLGITCGFPFSECTYLLMVMVCGEGTISFHTVNCIVAVIISANTLLHNLLTSCQHIFLNYECLMKQNFFYNTIIGDIAV